jgi:hypothetical protein
MCIIYNNNFFFLVAASLSGAFLYDEFLRKVKEFIRKEISLRELLRQYNRFQKGMTPLGIILKMYFAMQLLYWSISMFKLVASIESVFLCFLLIIGLSLIKSIHNDIIEFNR